MTRLAAIVILVSGCFYTDPINQRPSIAIRQLPTSVAARGQQLLFDATTSTDPDGDSIAFQWRAYACDALGSCDTAPFDTAITDHATFTVPMARGLGLPLEAVYVTLEAHDDYGAVAKPSQEVFVAINDQAPVLEVRKEPRNAYVVNTPVDLFAKVADLDDGPDQVTVAWSFDLKPPGALAGLVDLSVTQDPDDPKHRQFGKVLTPDVVGDWTVSVTASDPYALMASMPIAIHVTPDHAPCLATWAPAASQQTAQLIPITDPTLFQVLVVDDDLDPFPSVPDSLIGQTEFHWSIVPPGGTRTPLTGVTGSGVGLDPASYIPGDIVELRVEIQDRKHLTVNCPDTQMVCSVISDATCNQRLTWRVEMQ